MTIITVKSNDCQDVSKVNIKMLRTGFEIKICPQKLIR